jgi:hypothetical protein
VHCNAVGVAADPCSRHYSLLSNTPVLIVSSAAGAAGHAEAVHMQLWLQLAVAEAAVAHGQCLVWGPSVTIG